jgi:hypothetical protein
MLSPNKCRGRSNVACSPLFASTDQPCTTDASCGPGHVCEGVCFAVIPGCTPVCNGDADCGAGRFCSPQTGLCSGTAQGGLPNGAACVQPAAGSPDPCRGVCIGLTSGSGPAEAFVCADKCELLVTPNCGWAGPASGTAANDFCLFASGVIIDPGAGDLGSCANLCNCDGDCRNPALVCAPFDNAQLEQALRRRGYCTLPSDAPGIPCP